MPSNTGYSTVPQAASSKRMPKSKFYAVAVGRNGSHIYTTWKECQAQVLGYSNATYKSFRNRNDAEHYIQQKSNSNISTSNSHTNSATTDATFGTTDKYTGTEFSSKTNTLSMNNNNNDNTVVASADADAAADNNTFVTTNTSESNKRRRMMNNRSSNSSLLEVKPLPIGVATAEEVAAQVPIPILIPPTKIWFDVMFDGGSRGNPNGHAGSGTYIVTRRFYDTTTTNNTDDPSNTQEKKSNTNTKKTPKTIIHRDKMLMRSYLGFGLLTNNQAEYNGCIVALEQIQLILQKDTLQRRQYYQRQQKSHQQQSQQQSHNESKRDVTIVIQGDSQLIIKQLKGMYQCKSPKLRPYYKKAVHLLGEIKKEIDTVDVGSNSSSSGDNAGNGRRYNNEYDITFEHVYREHNKIADGLANDAMDSTKSWTTFTTTTPPIPTTIPASTVATTTTATSSITMNKKKENDNDTINKGSTSSNDNNTTIGLEV